MKRLDFLLCSGKSKKKENVSADSNSGHTAGNITFVDLQWTVYCSVTCCSRSIDISLFQKIDLYINYPDE